MDSVAARYHVVLKDQYGENLAIFDQFDKLTFEHRLNDRGSYSIEFQDDGDDRFDLFELDGRVEVYRSVPGCDVTPYREFIGLHRKTEREMDDGGVKTFVSIGVDPNDLLRRKVIAYKAGTIRADKDAPSETVIKEFVEENLGPTADDTVVGRLYQGGFPFFSVEEDGAGYGILREDESENWSGSRAYENILDVIMDISVFSGIDFCIKEEGGSYIFRTYDDQMGSDRTDIGLTDYGVNQDGNAPVVFNVSLGNVQETEYVLDRLSEVNVVIVLGEGELSTRDTLTVSDQESILDSPWNILEVSRPVGDFDPDFATYSMTVYGEEVLEENQMEETFSVIPLQQPSTLYGKHYFLGDRIVVQQGDIKRYKKITAVKITVDAKDGREDIEIEFSDIPIK